MGYNWIVRWFIAIGRYFNTLDRLKWEFTQKVKQLVITNALSKLDAVAETVKSQDRKDFCHSMGCLDEYKSEYERLSNVKLMTFEEFETLGPDVSDDDSAFECEI